MALSPAQKIRSPQLGIGSCRKTRSSNVVGEANCKQLHKDPSTPLINKNISFPRNEIPNNQRVQENNTLKNGNTITSVVTGCNEVKDRDKRITFKETHATKCSEGETVMSPKQTLKKEVVSHLKSDKYQNLMT